MSESGKPVGLKFDAQKPDMSLIPAAAAIEEAAIWTFGKQKYSAYNWHNGISYSRILAGMERHLTLLKAGIDSDYENSRHHAAAIRCGAAMLIQFTLEDRKDLDDRMLTTEATRTNIERMIQGESIFDIIGGVHGGTVPAAITRNIKGS